MADPPHFPNAGEPTPSTPRWVKVFGIIAIVVALLFVVQLLVGGGRHGPNRHRMSDGGQILPTKVAEVGALPPEVGDR